MADAITERFKAKPKSENFIKKIITLTAKEFESPNIEETYVPKEI